MTTPFFPPTTERLLRSLEQEIQLLLDTAAPEETLIKTPRVFLRHW
jgi:hypothetical protein